VTGDQGWGAPPPPAAGWGAPAYPPPYGYGTGQQTEGLAIGALVCSIGSFFVCPVVLAIVGLVLAQNAQNRIDAGAGRLSGAGLVTAARIVAWVNLALYVLALIGVIIAGFVLGARG
jgi:hypothetical protein